MVAKRTKHLGRRVRVAGRGEAARDRELAASRLGGRRVAGSQTAGAGGAARDRLGRRSKPQPDSDAESGAAGDADSVTDAEAAGAEAVDAVGNADSDAAAVDVEPDSGAGDETAVAAGRGRTRRARDTFAALRPTSARSLIAVIVLSALLGGGLAYWFHSEADALRSAPGAQNEAVIDPVRTNEVATQLSGRLEKLWSYDYSQLDKQQGEVRDAATASFLDDYAKQFKRIKQLAPGQQAVVDAKVVDIAVSRLDGDRADLVVFLNQVATKGTSKDTTRAAARLRVAAERVDGQWLVSGVTPF